MSCTGLLRVARVSIPDSVHTTVKQFPISCLRRRYGWRNVDSEYIYIALAVYVAYDVTVSFFTIVFGLYIEIIVLFLNQNTWREMTLSLFTLTAWTRNLMGVLLLLFVFCFYRIHILFCIKTISKWRIYLHAKTFKLKLKMSSFIFRRQPLVTK